MKRNRWMSASLVLALTVSLLAACSGNGGNGGEVNSGGNGKTETESSSGGKKTEVIKLKMWGGVPVEAGPQAVVDAWNAEHPDIQVEYERFVNDDAGNMKLDTALTTGQGADLFVNYAMPRLKQRIDAGQALDLSEFADYNIDEQMGRDASQWKVDGKYYGMPTTRGISFMWLNKDMLDAAGLPIPPADWTWADLREYAKKLKTDATWGLLRHEAIFMNPFNSVLESVGVTRADGTSNLDHPLLKEGFSTWHDMMFADKSTPTYGEQMTSKMPVDTMFLKGESAMLDAGGFIFRNANNLTDNPRTFKIAFATTPRMSADQQGAKAAGGLGDVLSINAKSANKEAAWQFLKWYADGGMLPMAAGGRIPASKSVNGDEAAALLLKGVEDKYDIDSLKKVVFGQFETFVESLPQQVVDIRKAEYEKYLLQQAELDASLAEMAEKHNEFLKQQP
ncbi:ABC transporter substrate-binding protein [Paenibacillus methanolicus]|uniref:Multiple sugar transport system substrate-binding protein n=1 Tax=Paenibacillus methanolicus TaxID=582686 RepID=A0A5S5CHD7_9BACL|nr:extracellular solute-binding protein [Paenibacillus methanolicus]TYP79132.1 multiple sugar transport system substrate-binding protein [Paenibacillus methanolicus]